MLGNLSLSAATCSDVFRHPLQMEEGIGQTSDSIKNDAELLKKMSEQ
jgi:hypothetical protein